MTTDSASDDQPEPRRFTPAELGALAHLYRGEIYRSTVWRTRLDTTTNWSVVTLGVALSITFASRDSSPLPLVLVGILILLFLALEARRYRYFNVWRARARWMEKHLYVPMLRDGVLDDGTNWQLTLADDYRAPRYHVSYLVAMSRRIRRNYLWILLIQSIAYVGKLLVHPNPVTSLSHFIERARIGPIPGVVVLATGLLYIGVFLGLAIWVRREDARRATMRGSQGPMG
ncbi:DUF2270 domain-containing protein [Paracoccus sp. SJTW-4]|uniref:DUF2270 domain-containing protein n=1 Tax=Paracoccus sp. SJTW-4 TaxID=3078428 RepID=UPI0039ED2A50